MRESLGTDVMAQFGPGGRDPTREEEAKMQHCFDRGQGDEAQYEEGSEERRVGKGGRSRWAPDHLEQNGPGGRDPTREEEAKMQYCLDIGQRDEAHDSDRS